MASALQSVAEAGSPVPVASGAPFLSIVIPARDAAATLPETLASVARLAATRPFEAILVDDGSSDATAAIAAAAGARVVPCEGRGVADARNTGARVARGDVVLFADADVILPVDTIEVLHDRLVVKGYDACTGRLSHVHRHAGFASQYKNLWMAFTYESLPEDVTLFYTSASAIRRELFLELGGFSKSFVAPSVEDTAFGQVLGDHGCRVAAEQRLAVEHLKAYTPREVLQLDFQRSRALTRVFLGRGRRAARRGNTSSVPTEFIVSVPLPAIALLLLVASPFTSRILAAFGLGAIALFWGCNARFLMYLARRRGASFALKAHGFLLFDALSVVLGILSGLVAGTTGRLS